MFLPFFDGYVYDEETGYHYLGSRYYNVQNCRFLNTDDIIQTQRLVSNLFTYCSNKPVNKFDINGLVESKWKGLMEAYIVNPSDVVIDAGFDKGEYQILAGTKVVYGNDDHNTVLSVAFYANNSVTGEIECVLGHVDRRNLHNNLLEILFPEVFICDAFEISCNSSEERVLRLEQHLSCWYLFNNISFPEATNKKDSIKKMIETFQRRNNLKEDSGCRCRIYARIPGHIRWSDK